MDTLTPSTLPSGFTTSRAQTPLGNKFLENEAQTLMQRDLEPDLPALTESELRSQRLDQFNEKIELLIEKYLSNDTQYDLNRLLRQQKSIVTDPNYIAPHIKVGPGVVRPTVIAVGDPFRCEAVAQMCEEYKQVQWNREYRLYNVTYEDAELSVISHGIGGPGAAICFEELVKLGAKTIIRLGTCGGLQPQVKTGDLIIASGAIREDGYSEWVAPKGFPAVGDNELTLALYHQAKSQNARVHIGVCMTTGLFYEGGAFPSNTKLNADAGAFMIEMEVATLFTVGIMRGIRTAAIATADGNLFNAGDYDPHGKIVAEGKENMLRIGLNVGKQASFDDNNSTALQIFDNKEQIQYIDMFRTQSLFDFVQEKSGLTDKQKVSILRLTQKGSLSNFKFYLEKGTSLSEQDIKQAMILYHKVQKGGDENFIVKAYDFIKKLNESN